MPKNKQSGIRINCLLYILSSANHLTKEEILNKLSKDFDIKVSWESVKKDFQEINKENKVIEYDGYKKAYFLSDKGGHLFEFSYSGEQRKAMELASAILNNLGNIPLLKDFDSLIKKLLKVSHTDNKLNDFFRSIVQMESIPNALGNEWIGPIFNAIRNGKAISISYKKFESSSSKQHDVHPFLLKEYRNRWYLICRPTWSEKPITFALDRILDVQEKEEDLVWENFDPKEFYKHSIGITANQTEEVLKVKLKVASNQLNYLKTVPIHQSQEIIEENEAFGIVTLQVLYSYELIKEIMGMNEDVEVLEPDSLRKEIVERYKKALGKY